ncbi:MAG: type II secretion system F family protein [Proteocatella sp.]
MLYTAIFSGIVGYCIIIIFFGKRYMEKIEIDKRINDIEKSGTKNISFVEEELSKTLSERILAPLWKKIMKVALKVVPKARDKNLKKQLLRAGINMSVDEFNALRMIFIMVMGVLFFVRQALISQNLFSNIFWAIIGLAVGYFMTIIAVKFKTSKRRDVINMQLPEVMDLLSISVEAGLGFDQALKEVAEAFQGPLLQEFNIAKREMQLGLTKKEALLEMADRCQVEDLSLFVSAIIQGEQFGISLKSILRTQSFAIRLRHKQRIEEKAAKLPVKIILPVAAFIFPVLFIVVVGPAVFNLYTALKGL